MEENFILPISVFSYEKVNLIQPNLTRIEYHTLTY